MRGLPRTNLHYMRQAATVWPDPVVQQPVGQLPWGHITVLLDKLDNPAERDWYAAAALQHGWFRKVVLNQIIGRLHQRVGAAPSNFARRLAESDSELAHPRTRPSVIVGVRKIIATGPGPLARGGAGRKSSRLAER